MHTERAEQVRRLGAESVLDWIGLGVGAAAVGWIFVAGASSGGSPGSSVGLIVASAAALIAGRVGGSHSRRLVGAVVGSTSIAVLVWGAVEGKLTNPLGYANASGAFALQGSVAGLMLGMSGYPAWVRRMGFGCALGLALVPFALRSTAAEILILLPTASLAIVHTAKQARAAIVVGGAAFLVVLLTTVTLAVTYREGHRADLLSRLVDSSLSERRVALWHDAFAIMSHYPLTGVGPGRFPSVSPVAMVDVETRQAHNEFLQQGAEGGFAGLLLAICLFLWGFVRLFVVQGADRVTFLGAASLAALGIHASIDYILHFPLVPVMAAALIGAAQVSTRRGRRRPKGGTEPDEES